MQSNMLTMPLVDEARRQLNICNACRYCEGLCAVFVALERPIHFETGEVTHLANLCHDCRSCLYACPYTAPHEFAINPPKLFAKARRETYDSCIQVPIPSLGKWVNGWIGIVAALLVFLLGTTVIAIATMGAAALVSAHPVAASPYSTVPYPAILIETLLPFLFSCIVLVHGARKYWRVAGTSGALPGGWRAIVDCIYEAGSLKNLRGGGEPCHENARPSKMRRIWHQCVSYGFVFCLMSTISAAVLQDIVGRAPPYVVWSIPVVLGLVGGAGMTVGCSALIITKGRADREATDARMESRDYGLLIALEFIAVTGIMTILSRNSAAYGSILVFHLATVGTAFAVAPYTKFVHWIYRSMALYRDAVERHQECPAPAFIASATADTDGHR